MIPTSLITFAQLANSLFRNAPNSSGELPTTSAPTPTMRSWIAGNASDFVTAWCTRLMIAGGVLNATMRQLREDAEP